jgi:putative oxidoreductase
MTKNRIFSMLAADSSFLKDIGLLFLRVSFSSALFFAHGLPKIVHFSQKVSTFPDPLGIGRSLSLLLTIFSEVNCSLLIFLGLFTRWAAFPVIVTLAVAWLVIHGGDSFDRQELPVLYLMICATLMISGAGRFSLDRFFFR